MTRCRVYRSFTFRRRGFPRCACRSCERVHPTPRSCIALLCPTSCEWKVPFFLRIIRTHIPSTPKPRIAADMMIVWSINQMVSINCFCLRSYIQQPISSTIIMKAKLYPNEAQENEPAP